MKYLLIGDVHGVWGAADYVINKAKEDDGPFDAIIQVGDMGFYFPGQSPWQTKYDEQFMWIDGNHDNHEMLANRHLAHFGNDPYHSFKPTEWKEFLNHFEYMPRGSHRDGILFIGGAKSIDRHYRTAGVDWWYSENISRADEDRTLATIDEIGVDNIDVVVSHDCPAGFDIGRGLRTFNGPNSRELYDQNRQFLEHIRKLVNPSKWFFGHYHFPWESELDGCEWRCLDTVHSDRGIDYAILEI